LAEDDEPAVRAGDKVAKLHVEAGEFTGEGERNAPNQTGKQHRKYGHLKKATTQPPRSAPARS
jgi:hypothetical protein